MALENWFQVGKLVKHKTTKEEIRGNEDGSIFYPLKQNRPLYSSYD